ncbi:MAG: hypothetical protein IPI67_23465 [Myxococcales bacterium]|nr:hypothetical protein [Myxococcales bacterium]
MPIVETKVCIKEKQRQIVTSSTVSSHGNLVNYGRTYPGATVSTIGLGEDAASGAFAGAGTNGGTNVAFIVNSCGLRARYWNAATVKFFAGVHSVHMLVPVAAWKDLNGFLYTSDARTEPQRGIDVAIAAVTNPNSAVASAWLNSTQAGYGFTSVPIGGGTPANHSWGCMMSIGRGHTQADANWHANQETWAQAKSESNDAIGSAYSRASIYCNYDSVLYGF